MHKYILATLATFCLLTTNVLAGSWGMGVAGTLAGVSASGSETESANTTGSWLKTQFETQLPEMIL